MKMIKINCKKGDVVMSFNEFARWTCLIEAFEFIYKRAKELNVDASDMVKPMAIEKYIEERYLSVLHDVQIEHQLGNI